MTDLFGAARRVASADVARQAGLQLKRRGGREWACCPLHGEKTPSLCFYPDGGWHCFGCHAGGDAVALHAALYRVSPVEAARALTGADGLPRAVVNPVRRRKREFLAGTDEDGFTWDRLCQIRNAACAVIGQETGDTPRLWDAVAARAFAEERMDNMLMEDMDEQQGSAAGV